MPLDRLTNALPELRPELHRYCARMTGSVIDGEDVLQDALMRATEALQRGDQVRELRPWLFRIAHNTALNHLRAEKSSARARTESAQIEATQPHQTPMIVSTTLRPFLALPARQRSAVLLRDVLGYTAGEVAEITDTSVSAVKSALHRGRSHLRNQEQGDGPAKADRAPIIADTDVLAEYVRCFNNHEFDRLRDMLADEVRLELVARENRNGRAGVSGYFGNYAQVDDWWFSPGLVEGWPAALAFDRQDRNSVPTYFVLLTFDHGHLTHIRDFRYARYVSDALRWQFLDQ